MNYYTIRLDELYSIVGGEGFLNVINNFEPAYNDVDASNYLKNKALENIRNSKSITYVSIDDKGSIAGYYTLAMTYVPILPNDNVSNNLKKKMESVPVENKELL